MHTNILTTAVALSNRDLLTRLDALAATEREASVELVAHLAVLDTRPQLYASQGYGSLFSYCTRALKLSEDAACNRIEAARACREFPAILDLLGSGSMTLTSVRLLRRHLTPENHEAVLAKASGRSRHEIELLIAELAPRPDVPTSVRKLPATATPPPSPAVVLAAPLLAPSESVPERVSTPVASRPTPRPVVQATAPERYRVQFTIGPETHEKLRRVQSLLRREIPDGDAGAIFDRALTPLLERVEKAKLGKTARPRPGRSIRPGTNRDGALQKPRRPSRHVPRAVKREVWRRDAGQCAFVSPEGRRCDERDFLEYHHVQPFAKQGPSTVENISLRCWRHNQYEAELIFDAHGASIAGEGRESYGVGAARRAAPSSPADC